MLAGRKKECRQRLKSADNLHVQCGAVIIPILDYQAPLVKASDSSFLSTMPMMLSSASNNIVQIAIPLKQSETYSFTYNPEFPGPLVSFA